MGYISQKLWHILGKNYGIYWVKIMEYIAQNHDIGGKSYRIYWERPWDTLDQNIGYIRQIL